MIYWSFDARAAGRAQPEAAVEADEGLLARLQQTGWVLSNLFGHTRWERSFRIVR